MLWALLLGYWLCGELPDKLVYLGAAIVNAAGMFVIWRERQLGFKRAARGRGAAAGRVSAQEFPAFAGMNDYEGCEIRPEMP
jgi:hypothetical protein